MNSMMPIIELMRSGWYILGERLVHSRLNSPLIAGADIALDLAIVEMRWHLVLEPGASATATKSWFRLTPISRLGLP